MRNLFLICILLFNTAWAEPTSARVDEAREAFFKGNIKYARQLFKKCALEATTSEERAHVHQVAASCYQGAEDWGRAVSHQKKLIKAREERLDTQVDRTLHGDAIVGLARMYKKAGKPSQVDKTYAKALELKDMPENWVTRVTAEYKLYLEKTGQTAKAESL